MSLSTANAQLGKGYEADLLDYYRRIMESSCLNPRSHLTPHQRIGFTAFYTYAILGRDSEIIASVREFPEALPGEIILITFSKYIKLSQTYYN